MDYLDWLRWPAGPVCPGCGRAATTVAHGPGVALRWLRKRVSRTAGTIFQDTRTPLTVWFAAGWYMTADPGGVSALTMQKLLGLGSYQTAWTMLHRYRTAMVRPGREVLTGRVEVDETFLGGERRACAGVARWARRLVVIAVELHEPRGYGRARMSVIPNAEAKTLRKFLINTVEPGSTVVTDGWVVLPARRAGTGSSTSRTRSPAPGQQAQRAAARGAPRRLAVQAVAAGHPPRTRRHRSTCSPTWRSSASASTGATPAPAGCCSTGCMQYAAAAHR